MMYLFNIIYYHCKLNDKYAGDRFSLWQSWHTFRQLSIIINIEPYNWNETEIEITFSWPTINETILLYSCANSCIVGLAYCPTVTLSIVCQSCTAVIFNRGSVEPKGSANICQGFHSWPVTNNLVCEITPVNVVEIFSTESFVQNCVSLCLFLHRPTMLNNFCCW